MKSIRLGLCLFWVMTITVQAQSTTGVNIATGAFLTAGALDTASTIWMGPGYPGPWHSVEANPFIAWEVNAHPDTLYLGPVFDLSYALVIRHYVAPHHRTLAKVMLWTGTILHGMNVPNNLRLDIRNYRNEQRYGPQ